MSSTQNPENCRSPTTVKLLGTVEIGNTCMLMVPVGGGVVDPRLKLFARWRRRREAAHGRHPMPSSAQRSPRSCRGVRLWPVRPDTLCRCGLRARRSAPSRGSCSKTGTSPELWDGRLEKMAGGSMNLGSWREATYLRVLLVGSPSNAAVEVAAAANVGRRSQAPLWRTPMPLGWLSMWRCMIQNVETADQPRLVLGLGLRRRRQASELS